MNILKRISDSFRRKKTDVSTMSQWDLINLRFNRHKLAVFALIMIMGLYFIALFADSFAVNDPLEKDIAHIYCPPIFPKFSLDKGLYFNAVKQLTDPITLEKNYTFDPDAPVPLGFFVRDYDYRILGLIPTNIHFFGINQELHRKWNSMNPGRKDATTPKFMLFGADKFGRDVFSRIIIGSRISLSIGIAAIVVSFVLGVSLGGISGYVGGWCDILIQRSIEIINAFPKLPLWLALGAALPRSWNSLQVYLGITLILSLMGWTAKARVVRGKILSLREEDYAVAAKLLGASDARIIFRHLVPGFTSHIIVSLTMTVPAMILGETSLSFLGLGLKPPTISWGVMLQDCMSMQVVKSYPWLLLPAIMIIMMVLFFNFMGDGLRDAADPYS